MAARREQLNMLPYQPKLMEESSRCGTQQVSCLQKLTKRCNSSCHALHTSPLTHQSLHKKNKEEKTYPRFGGNSSFVFLETNLRARGRQCTRKGRRLWLPLDTPRLPLSVWLTEQMPLVGSLHWLLSLSSLVLVNERRIGWL